VRLKKLYTSREVAALTGLSARQLQWWHARGLFKPSVAPQRTDAGGFTERRYTPVELLELMVLADLRRRGFTIPGIRRLLDVLRSRFKVRLFEAIEGGGPITLLMDGDQIFARTHSGDIYNVLQNPTQPLLMLGENLNLRQIVAREGKRPPGRKGPTRKARRSETRKPSKRKTSAKKQKEGPLPPASGELALRDPD
jgi:DNA-binding transcriptional MerR regulator